MLDSECIGAEAAHGVAGDADDAVAGLILQDVGLLIHIGHGVVHGVDPEGRPDLHEAGAGVDLVVQVGVAVVILVQGQDHHAPAAQLDGVGVLHLGGVQVAVGDDDGGTGIFRRSSLGHVKQTAEGAVLRLKGDAGDRDAAVAAVVHACQNAACQDQDQSDAQHDHAAFLGFHAYSSYPIFSDVSGGNVGLIILHAF